MPQSMTGFGRGEAQGQKFQVITEIKTVNHRYKDLRFKMPISLNSQEIHLRKKIDSTFKRGTFEIFIQVKPLSDIKQPFEIDHDKVKAYFQEIESINQLSSFKLSPTTSDLLKSEFHKDENGKDEKQIYELVNQSFEIACAQLLQFRHSEGQKLVSVLEKHLNDYEEYFKVIESKIDYLQESLKERLSKKFIEYKEQLLNVDESRFLQEILFYLEKMDIHEELNRIKIHIAKVRSLLTGPNEIGRNLDFIIQELNRETNTIGSKSNDNQISDAVVNMKVQLEKIREQALNLE